MNVGPGGTVAPMTPSALTSREVMTVDVLMEKTALGIVSTKGK